MRILSLQSGTSADGIDVAVVDIVATGPGPTPRVDLRPVLLRTVRWPAALRSRILALADGDPAGAEEICQVDALCGQQFAAAAVAAIIDAGGAGLDAPVDIAPVDLVVSHGQTVFHWVENSHAAGTLQLGETSWIAEATGLPVLGNLRAADIAAGGDGAPLMGIFDRAWLGGTAAETGIPVATVNLGGIANLSLVRADGTVLAWDTGPGNALIDLVVARSTGGAIGYDAGGRIAAAGQVDEVLLETLTRHPYFLRHAPKSTGRETFGAAYIDAALAATAHPLTLEDLVATLTRLTARTIAESLRAESGHSAGPRPPAVIASGGGVRNPVLMRALAEELAGDGAALVSSADRDLDPDFKESLMFALLGFMTWHGIPCQLPGTDPAGARVAGQLAFGLGRSALPTPLDGIRSLRILGEEDAPAPTNQTHSSPTNTIQTETIQRDANQSGSIPTDAPPTDRRARPAEHPAGTAPIVLAVDLGKTSCRVRVTRAGIVLGEASGQGSPGLAEDHGARLAHEAILGALAGLTARAPEIAGVSVSARSVTGIDLVGIGAAGVEVAPAASRDMLQSLRQSLGAPIALINDGLAAHIGAFGGGPGTVLIAGTGAVVFTLDGAGILRQIDGGGPWLGDDGSGRWIGQHGLQAALRAHDGRGPETLLRGDAERLAGSLGALPAWVSAAGRPARTLGTFAPTVLERAVQGDGVAVALVREACALLAAACAAAAPGDGRVCVVGGLAAHPYFHAGLTSALRSVGLSIASPQGDPLTGAAYVAYTRGSPHEERIIRG